MKLSSHGTLYFIKHYFDPLEVPMIEQCTYYKSDVSIVFQDEAKNTYNYHDSHVYQDVFFSLELAQTKLKERILQKIQYLQYEIPHVSNNPSPQIFQAMKDCLERLEKIQVLF